MDPPKALIGLERYLDSVGRQAYRRPRTAPPREPVERRPVVTISRLAGAGAHVIADDLRARLGARAPEGSPPWTVFDRNLVDEVLKHHELPARLAAFMPEDRVSHIADAMEELFGLHPRTSTLVQKTADTILHLAEVGNVVLIGRGANVITAGFPWSLHVRLVGSEEKRVAYIQEHLHLGPGEAAEYIRAQDLGRERYVKEYYGKDIDDPLLYDLVINTDRVACAETARIIADAVYPSEPVEGTETASADRPSPQPVGPSA